jgi:hypothetical protein
MAMLRVQMVMGVGMPSSISVSMFVFVECDLKGAPEHIGDTAQRFQTGNVRAALQSRYHRFRHPEPFCELRLGFFRFRSQGQEPLCAMRSYSFGIV